MKRLITDTGGRPFKNPDALQYLQAFDIFEQWFDDLVLGDCIVYGCVISGGVGNYTVTSGVLYINGLLRLFDGVAGVAFPLVLKEEAIDVDLREYQEGVNKYTAQLFKMVPDVGGAFNFDLTTPRTKEQLLGSGALKTKTIDIGDWNLNVSAAGALSVNINHGFADHTKIKRVKVRIFVDDDAAQAGLIYDFEGPGDPITGLGLGGGKSWNNLSVSLVVAVGIFFDTADFDKLAYNRGEIIIDYID